MNTTISGLRHPLNAEQTAACEFPAFVHPTVAEYIVSEYDEFLGVSPGISREYMDCGYNPEKFNGLGWLFLQVYFDELVAEVCDVLTDCGYKKTKFAAAGMSLEAIRRKAADEAERLYRKYED